VGSSFTQYQGHGFWTRDAKIEIWLHLLVGAADRHPAPEPWLRRAVDHWRLQAAAGFQGCVDADLDELVGTAAPRLETLIAVAERAEGDLRRRPRIARDELAAAGVGGEPGQWSEDVDGAMILPVAKAFIDLLRGDLAWDAATSPMV
jgi:hypothetical protein